MKHLLALTILALLLCVSIAEPTCREVRIQFRLEGEAQIYRMYDYAIEAYLPFAQSAACAPRWAPPHAGITMVVWAARCGECLGQ